MAIEMVVSWDKRRVVSMVMRMGVLMVDGLAGQSGILAGGELAASWGYEKAGKWVDVKAVLTDDYKAASKAVEKEAQ